MDKKRTLPCPPATSSTPAHLQAFEMVQGPLAQSDLRTAKRYITTHDANGKAVLSTSLSPVLPTRDVLQGEIKFNLVYTNHLQPSFSSDRDIVTYKQHLDDPPAIVIPNGTVCRFCDFAPASLSPMHRTSSLDIGVVIEGEMELVLDGGERQRLYPGDTVVQRGTNHAWRNVTPSRENSGEIVPQWARMMFVLQAAQPVTLANGERLEEDEGGIDRGS